MSYASLAAPALPTISIPFNAINKAASVTLQSVGVAAILWLLLAAPGFLTDRTALHTSATIAFTR